MPSARTILTSCFMTVALVATLALAWRGGPECAAHVAPRFVAAKASPYPVGPMAGRPAVGDVNGDGFPDIVVACGTCCGSKPDPKSGHVIALLGDGRGNFRPAPGSPIKVGSSVRKLALGDINGDKILDIVAAEHDSHDLTILLGDGAGRFTKRGGTPPCVMTGPIKNPADGTMAIPRAHTHEVALADVNGDGRLDILATSVSAHGVAVLLNQSDGSFAHAAGSPFRIRTPYDAIATADLNGDGKIDIVVPSIAGSAVNILLGDGTGAFAPAAGSPIKVGERPGYVAVGDCNGDGKIDVFVTHDDVTTMDVLLNDGAGHFSPAAGSPLSVSVKGFLWGIAPADFNGDGQLDLALGNGPGDQIALLMNDSKGGFWPVDTPLKAGDGAGYVVAADLNGDGKMDLVTGNYGSGDLTILLAENK